MSAADVRNLYLEEVKILATVIDAARNNTSPKSELGKRLRTSWGDFLRMRQKGLERSLTLSDKEILDDIHAELEQLNVYIQAHNNNNGVFVDEWLSFLECERDFSKDILELYER